MGLLIELIFFKAGFWPGIALLTVETGENSMCPRGEGNAAKHGSEHHTAWHGQHAGTGQISQATVGGMRLGPTFAG